MDVGGCVFAYGALSVHISVDLACYNNLSLTSSLLIGANENKLLGPVFSCFNETSETS